MIEGITETPNEKLVDIAVDILSHALPRIVPADLDIAYRLGCPEHGPRPILVSLVRLNVKEAILKNKTNLKKIKGLKQVWINEDMNPTVKKQRAESRSLVRQAVKQGVLAKQRGTGLVVDGVYYPHSDLNKLPHELKLAATKTRKINTITAFCGHLAPLSNLYPAKVEIDVEIVSNSPQQSTLFSTPSAYLPVTRSRLRK